MLCLDSIISCFCFLKILCMFQLIKQFQFLTIDCLDCEHVNELLKEFYCEVPVAIKKNIYVSNVYFKFFSAHFKLFVSTYTLCYIYETETLDITLREKFSCFHHLFFCKYYSNKVRSRYRLIFPNQNLKQLIVEVLCRFGTF